jgi:shikimate kinase / 3-dehydroquinate synthase
MTQYERVALIGFSGTGKSTVAQLLADRLGWRCVDMDLALEREFGMTIPEVFEKHGESSFRAAERRQLERALAASEVVIATGGGASAQDDAWSPTLLGNHSTLAISLDASAQTMLGRMIQQQEEVGSAAGRPMLAGEAPLDRIETLKSKRQEAYDRADITLIVDQISADDVAREIADLVIGRSEDSPPAVELHAQSGRSSIYIGPGQLRRMGNLIRQHLPNVRKTWIVTDENVARIHGGPVRALLDEAGLQPTLVTVPPGETSKSLSGAGSLYDAMLDSGIERHDVVIALGGGMVGDLAGFVAATVLRGVGLVQVPTSLLAMVDSSVGGKTGINHRAGKNLIGAFYQPPLVIIDPMLLTTLPGREFRQGWAEIIKHSAIQPSTPEGQRADLDSFLARNRERLVALEEPALSYLIRRNVELKADVVEADEREAGLRALLNFGHTFGHAIEAADYRFLHGEAVAIGMTGAARLSALVGLASDEMAERLRSRIKAFGLPTESPHLPVRVISLMASDKKRAQGRQKWILMCEEGGVTIRDDIASELVLEALDSISTTESVDEESNNSASR